VSIAPVFTFESAIATSFSHITMILLLDVSDGLASPATTLGFRGILHGCRPSSSDEAAA
jgi:hypothetical protein